MDVSFISVLKILPALRGVLAPGGRRRSCSSSRSSRWAAPRWGAAASCRTRPCTCRRVRDVAAAAQHELGYAVRGRLRRRPSPAPKATASSSSTCAARGRRSPTAALRGDGARRRWRREPRSASSRGRTWARPGPTLRELVALAAASAGSGVCLEERTARAAWTDLRRGVRVALGQGGRGSRPTRWSCWAATARCSPPATCSSSRSPVAGRELRQPRLPHRDHAARALSHPRERARRRATAYEERRLLARGGAARRPAADAAGDVLNDVVITKAALSRIIELDVTVDGALRLRLPRRRPHRLLAHRLHRLQPRRRRAHPAPHPARGRAHAHLPAHAHQPAAGGERRASTIEVRLRAARDGDVHITLDGQQRLRRSRRQRHRDRDAQRRRAAPGEGARPRLLRGPAHEAEVGRADRASLGLDAGVALALAVPVALWRARVHAAPTARGRCGAACRSAGRGPPRCWPRCRRAPRRRACCAAHPAAACGGPLLVLLLAAAPLVPLFTGRALRPPRLPGRGAASCWRRRRWPWRSRAARGPATAPGAAPTAAVLFAAAFLFYALLGTRIPGPAGPQGDEPHYLVMAQSLWSDGDLDLRDELARREYARFFVGHAPARTPRRAAPPDGSIPSTRPAWPSLLAARPTRWAATPGARLFMSALAALAAVLVHRLRARRGRSGPPPRPRRWARSRSRRPWRSTPCPLYPEVPAALAPPRSCSLARRGSGLARGDRWPRWPRSPAVAAPRLPAAGRAGPGPHARAPVPWAARAARRPSSPRPSRCSSSFFHSLYGRASLAAAYGPGFSADVSPARAPWGAAALLLDRQFGLLAIAPVFAPRPARGRCSCADGGRATRCARRCSAARRSWWAPRSACGGAARARPARFVVPALPALALALAPALRARRDAAAALVGIGARPSSPWPPTPRAPSTTAPTARARCCASSPRPSTSTAACRRSSWTGSGAAPRGVAARGRRARPAGAAAARPRRRRAAATRSLAAGLRTEPLLDRRLATLDLLEAWEPRAVRRPDGPARARRPPGPARPRGARPGCCAPCEIQTSRRIDVPPGLYRLEVVGARASSAERGRPRGAPRPRGRRPRAGQRVPAGRPAGPRPADPVARGRPPAGARRLGRAGRGPIEERAWSRRARPPRAARVRVAARAGAGPLSRGSGRREDDVPRPQRARGRGLPPPGTGRDLPRWSRAGAPR